MVLYFLTCCQKEEKKTELQQNLQRLSPQLFTINPTKDTSLIGEKGTQISIRANSFDLRNHPATDKIEIRLNEHYSVADFIANRLSTKTTDGRLLKSSGMVFLQAQINGREIKLKENQAMTLQFPKKQTSAKANLFKGERGKDNQMLWILLPDIQQDTLTIRTIKLDSIDSRGLEYTRVNLNIKIGNDTIELTEENRRDFQNILAKPHYIFQTTEMGWINCDIFIEEELFPFIVKTTHSGGDVFVLLDSLNSVLYPDPDSMDSKNKSYTFNLPKGKSISVVSYKAEDTKHLFDMQKTNSSQGKVLMEEQLMSLKNIKEVIKNLQ